MELLDLTEQIVNKAKDDAGLQQKTREMALTLVIVTTGDGDTACTITIDHGSMGFSLGYGRVRVGENELGAMGTSTKRDLPTLHVSRHRRSYLCIYGSSYLLWPWILHRI